MNTENEKALARRVWGYALQSANLVALATIIATLIACVMVIHQPSSFDELVAARAIVFKNNQ